MRRLLAFNGRHVGTSWTFLRVDGRDEEVLTFAPYVATNDYAALVPALVDGVGIGVLPPIFRPEMLRDGLLVEVMPEWRPRQEDLMLVHLGSRHMPRPARVFKDFAVRTAPAFPPICRLERAGIAIVAPTRKAFPALTANPRRARRLEARLVDVGAPEMPNGLRLTIAVAAMTMLAAATSAKADDARSGIEKTLAKYNAALNGGNTSAVLPLYAADGVFMAPYGPSAVGIDAVKVAYDHVFDELKFHVKFDVAEIVEMSPSWAFVRTNSAGTTDHHSTGKTTAEANQELFIFKKGDDGEWRIARYSFSPTNPPR